MSGLHGLIDLQASGYIAVIFGHFKFKQILLKTSEIWTASGVFYYSEPLNNVLIEDLGLCWTTPPTEIHGCYDF